ncbi:hypothetical protein MSG28_004168 [Choristoneura fumiferana]|uniref:Uncharacterized protein n=1 Tax=Choristoneura fumiferana TaxID=7141 RepID=A0ACC0KIL5_CHOFU|nr:hypothetical protein MSG28_004168 [Choristoneura fumiferana]
MTEYKYNKYVDQLKQLDILTKMEKAQEWLRRRETEEPLPNQGGHALPYSMILGQEFLQHCVVLMENNDVSLKPVCNVEQLTPKKEFKEQT